MTAQKNKSIENKKQENKQEQQPKKVLKNLEKTQTTKQAFNVSIDKITQDKVNKNENIHKNFNSEIVKKELLNFKESNELDNINKEEIKKFYSAKIRYDELKNDSRRQKINTEEFEKNPFKIFLDELVDKVIENKIEDQKIVSIFKYENQNQNKSKNTEDWKKRIMVILDNFFSNYFTYQETLEIKKENQNNQSENNQLPSKIENQELEKQINEIDNWFLDENKNLKDLEKKVDFNYSNYLIEMKEIEEKPIFYPYLESLKEEAKKIIQEVNEVNLSKKSSFLDLDVYKKYTSQIYELIKDKPNLITMLNIDIIRFIEKVVNLLIEKFQKEIEKYEKDQENFEKMFSPLEIENIRSCIYILNAMISKLEEVYVRNVIDENKKINEKSPIKDLSSLKTEKQNQKEKLENILSKKQEEIEKTEEFSKKSILKKDVEEINKEINKLENQERMYKMVNYFLFNNPKKIKYDNKEEVENLLNHLNLNQQEDFKKLKAEEKIQKIFDKFSSFKKDKKEINFTDDEKEFIKLDLEKEIQEYKNLKESINSLEKSKNSHVEKFAKNIFNFLNTFKNSEDKNKNLENKTEEQIAEEKDKMNKNLIYKYISIHPENEEKFNTFYENNQEWKKVKKSIFKNQEEYNNFKNHIFTIKDLKLNIENKNQEENKKEFDTDASLKIYNYFFEKLSTEIDKYIDRIENKKDKSKEKEMLSSATFSSKWKTKIFNLLKSKIIDKKFNITNINQNNFLILLTDLGKEIEIINNRISAKEKGNNKKNLEVNNKENSKDYIPYQEI